MNKLLNSGTREQMKLTFIRSQYNSSYTRPIQEKTVILSTLPFIINIPHPMFTLGFMAGLVHGKQSRNQENEHRKPILAKSSYCKNLHQEKGTHVSLRCLWIDD